MDKIEIRIAKISDLKDLVSLLTILFSQEADEIVQNLVEIHSKSL